MCNASGIKEEVLASNQLMKDKRIFHAFFNSPTNSELRILSVVARQSPKYQGILKILEQLGLRYNVAQDSIIQANLNSEGSFDDYLRTAKIDIKTGSEGNWPRRLTQAIKYLFILIVTLIACYAFYLSIN